MSKIRTYHIFYVVVAIWMALFFARILVKDLTVQELQDAYLLFNKALIWWALAEIYRLRHQLKVH